MPGATKDYYSILGVGREASDEEIKRAYRGKARETHPDVAEHDGAEDAFKDISEAYEVLSDPQKRAMYDRFGTVDPRGAGQYADVSDLFGNGMEEIFSTFFGGGFGAGPRRARTEGRDMTVQVTVTLEEASVGVEKDVRISRDAPCETCSATGAAEDGAVVTCPDCQGSGAKRVQRRSFLGVLETTTPCDRCAQTGVIVDQPCPVCSGSGRARRDESVRVTIPLGIRDGMSLRVSGNGEAGIRGARSGDLLVGVHVAPHEYLHREGEDLHCRVSIGVAQAALGADVVVPGIWGDESVHIAAGTQHGDVVRVRGRGMPRIDTGMSGDLMVHVAVRVPKKLNKRQKELYKQLAEESGDATHPTVLERIKDWLNG